MASSPSPISKVKTICSNTSSMDLSHARWISLKASMIIRVEFWRIEGRRECKHTLSVSLAGEPKGRKNTGEPVTLGEVSGAREEISE